MTGHVQGQSTSAIITCTRDNSLNFGMCGSSVNWKQLSIIRPNRLAYITAYIMLLTYALYEI